MFKVGVVEGSAGIDIYLKDISLATPGETAVGNRIDKCKCVATRTYENDICDKCGLQDTDDNSDLEYHVSPLCKVEVK